MHTSRLLTLLGWMLSRGEGLVLPAVRGGGGAVQLGMVLSSGVCGAVREGVALSRVGGARGEAVLSITESEVITLPPPVNRMTDRQV